MRPSKLAIIVSLLILLSTRVSAQVGGTGGGVIIVPSPTGSSNVWSQPQYFSKVCFGTVASPTGGIDISGGLMRFTSDCNTTLIGLSALTAMSTRLNIITTSADGVIATNTTASTAGVPVQYSPRIRLTGTAWDTNDGAGASHSANWIIESQPVSSTTIGSTLNFLWDDNAGGYNSMMRVNESGNFTTTGNIVAASTGTISGGYVTTGSTPSVANVGANSCGTTAASVAGNSNSGRVTVGATSGTQCRVATPITAAVEWNCTASNDTTANLARCVGVDTTHFDLLGVFGAGDVISYVALPR